MVTSLYRESTMFCVRSRLYKYLLKAVVCPIKTIKRYDSLPRLAGKYTHAQTGCKFLTVINGLMEHARSIVIIKHKYILMCNHKI